MMQASVELNQNCVAHCDDKCSLTIKHVHAALIANTTMQLLLVKDWIYIMSTKPAFYHHEVDQFIQQLVQKQKITWFEICGWDFSAFYKSSL